MYISLPIQSIANKVVSYKRIEWKVPKKKKKKKKGGMQPVDDPIIVKALERAREVHKQSQPVQKPSSWSFLSFTGLVGASTEPTAEELLDALVAEMNDLSPKQLMAIVSPSDPERRKVFVQALTKVSMALVPKCALEADDLFDRCNVAWMSVTKSPQQAVDQAQLMYDWMLWRFENQYQYDSALHYLVEAEYQLHDAKAPGLLTRPSEATINQANALLTKVGSLREKVLRRMQQDIENLSESIAHHGERIAALQKQDEAISKLMGV